MLSKNKRFTETLSPYVTRKCLPERALFNKQVIITKDDKIVCYFEC